MNPHTHHNSFSGSGHHVLPSPPELDEEILDIPDVYRSVSGDVFHYMDRVKVPVNHSFKKAYYVCLQAAFLIPHPGILQEVEKVLSMKHGLTTHQVSTCIHMCMHTCKHTTARTHAL
jgi:hypothetical protein